MRKTTLTLFSFVCSLSAFAQVGINSTTPKATLEIKAQTLDGSKAEGVIAPRLTGDQIKAGDLQYGNEQTGAIIYATQAVQIPSAKTSAITEAGYYYFDGSVWQKMGGTIQDINIYKDNGILTSNRTVAMNDKTLAFTSSATTGTSHFSVDGSTFSVDAVNNKIGIGTTVPTALLDINNGTAKGAIKIVDGTQGNGRILTSDDNGLGTWQDGNLKTLIGITSTAGNIGSPQGFTYLPNWGDITITSGTWLIAAKYTSQNAANSSYASWIRLVNKTNYTEIATAGMVPETVGARLATPIVQALVTVTSTTSISVQAVNGCNCATLTPDFGGSQFYAIKLY